MKVLYIFLVLVVAVFIFVPEITFALLGVDTSLVRDYAIMLLQFAWDMGVGLFDSFWNNQPLAIASTRSVSELSTGNILLSIVGAALLLKILIFLLAHFGGLTADVGADLKQKFSGDLLGWLAMIVVGVIYVFYRLSGPNPIARIVADTPVAASITAITVIATKLKVLESAVSKITSGVTQMSSGLMEILGLVWSFVGAGGILLRALNATHMIQKVLTISEPNPYTEFIMLPMAVSEITDPMGLTFMAVAILLVVLAVTGFIKIGRQAA